MTTDNIQFSNLLNNAITQPGVLSSAYTAFYNYSIGNQIAAAIQCISRGIEISPIASYKAWQEKGRQVKKGEKAIALCMPITCKGEKPNRETGENEEFSFSRFVWKNNWFALSQTDGDDYANEITTPNWDKSKALETLGITEG